MQIGDKVRALRGKEAGIVTALLSNNQVEVELEDGFRIPFVRSDLVTVSPVEAERMAPREPLPPQKTPLQTPTAVLAHNGIYFGFAPLNDRDYALYLINNTDWGLLFTVGEETVSAQGITTYRGVLSGTLNPRTSQKMPSLYVHSGFETWPTWVVQGLWFRDGKADLRPAWLKRFRARANSLFKTKTSIPILNQTGFLTQLDADQPDAEKLKTQLSEPSVSTSATPIERPTSVVDLHIEMLLPDGVGGRSASDVLGFQLDTFAKTLEAAIAHSMHDITFIHGVGSGTLRTEIQKRLGQHPDVRFFEDAQKEKFGYGATKATLR